MRPDRIGWGTAVASLLALVTAAGPAAAQDSHYWTNQYGTRAELLGGNVVGSIKDLACVYYNPGAMALSDTPELVLTTDAFQVEVIDVEESRSRTLTSTEAGKAPSIFAVRLDAIDPLGTRGIALSFLTRQDFQATFSDAFVTPADEPLPGGLFASGEEIFDQKLYESWFGATLAQKYGRFGIGVSLFGAYRSQSGRTQMLAAITDGVAGGRSIFLVDQYRYWHVRVLAKIGVAWEWTGFSFGLAATTPGLQVIDDASLLSLQSVTNLADGNGGAYDALSSDLQEGLEAKFRSPASLAIGGSWKINSASALHVSAEYFAKVDTYTVIEGAPYTGQTSGVEVHPEVRNGSRAAFNWGLGYELVLSQGISLYGGFWVDRSTSDEDIETGLSITNWDIYHVTAGSNFQVRALRLTLGIAYARGSAPSTRQLDLGGIGIPGEIEGSGNVTYRRLKGILGLSFEV